MNYYPFHIGDFAAHTSHLTWEEDIAYRRMLDAYYLREKALPASVSEIARLIRMRDSLVAIQAVLDEFFDLSDDGWHNKRADAELSEMASKQEQQATKDAHEADRMRRYRERRAEMFAALRPMGVVPAWDVGMKELQRLFDTTCNAPETRTGPLPETDAQRLFLPTPTPTPTPIEEEIGRLDESPSAPSSAEPTTPPLPACPFEDIVALYHKHLPMLPKAKLLPDDRKRALRKFWAWVLASKKSDGSRRATSAAEALAWFDDYFELATHNGWINGTDKPAGEHSNWRADIDYLIGPKGLKQVIEKTQPQ